MKWRINPSALMAFALSTCIFAGGCTSTTAPPVVPAPDQKDPSQRDTEKPIASAPQDSKPPSEVAIAPPQETPAAESKPVAKTTAPPDESVAATNSPTPEASVAINPQPDNPAESPVTAATTPPGEQVKSTKDGVVEPKKPKYDRSDLIRLIAFAPAGPMVIDLKVYLDGEPLGKVRSAAIDRIFAAIDEDADGRITWEQFTQNPRVKSGLYGNAAVADGANLDDLLEKYDVIKNGRVDKEELPRFFSDDRGATKAFSLLAPARPLGSPGEDSLILAWLDMDGDGQLSKEEMSEAKAQLRIRDSDDDRVLSASELAPQMSTGMVGMMPTRKPSSGPPSGMLLGPNPRWETLSYYLEEIYAGAGKKLRTSHFPGTPELAKLVDGNKDGKISPIELQNFENAPADLLLTLHYVSRHSEDNAASKMEATPLAQDWAKWQSVWKQTDSSAQFSADEYTISFAMADLVGVNQGMEIAKSMFAQIDADKNGYLDEKEFMMPQAANGLTFAQVDENKDGKVYLEEVEKLTAERQIVAGTQAVIKVEVTGDPFLGVLDRDGDGRLSDREMREAEKNLAALDKDEDGLVGIGELPQSMKISVIRGIVAEGTVIPDLPTMAATTTPADSPLWFSKMDTNGDSELNEIEFIGSTEQFASLDKDKDGVVSLSEIEKTKVETNATEADPKENEKKEQSEPAEPAAGAPVP